MIGANPGGLYPAGELIGIDSMGRAGVDSFRRDSDVPAIERIVQPHTPPPAGRYVVTAFASVGGATNNILRVKRANESSDVSATVYDCYVWSWDRDAAQPVANVGRVNLQTSSPWRVGSIIRALPQTFADGVLRLCAWDSVEGTVSCACS